jgi:hypothetical protein
MNAHYIPGVDNVRFDFDSTLQIDLEKCLGRGLLLGDIPGFFEQIFEYAETQTGRDPTWGFGQISDAQGRSWPLLGLIMAFLRRDAVNTIDLVSYARDFVTYLG